MWKTLSRKSHCSENIPVKKPIIKLQTAKIRNFSLSKVPVRTCHEQ